MYDRQINPPFFKTEIFVRNNCVRVNRKESCELGIYGDDSKCFTIIIPISSLSLSSIVSMDECSGID